MNDTPGLARPKKKQTDAQGKPTLTKDAGLNTAKAKKATKKESRTAPPSTCPTPSTKNYAETGQKLAPLSTANF